MTVARIRLPDAPDERRAEALRRLAVLVDLFERGMREPLPLYCKTSAAYAAAVAAGKDGPSCGRKAVDLRLEYPKEDAEPEHLLVLGGTRTVDELFEEPPRDDEQGDGWAPTSRRAPADTRAGSGTGSSPARS